MPLNKQINIPDNELRMLFSVTNSQVKLKAALPISS